MYVECMYGHLYHTIVCVTVCTPVRHNCTISPLHSEYHTICQDLQSDWLQVQTGYSLDANFRVLACNDKLLVLVTQSVEGWLEAHADYKLRGRSTGTPLAIHNLPSKNSAHAARLACDLCAYGRGMCVPRTICSIRLYHPLMARSAPMLESYEYVFMLSSSRVLK